MTKRFKFRLQSVLQLRQQQMREIERKVIGLVAKRRSQDFEIRQLYSLIENANFQTGNSISISHVVAASQYVKQIEIRLAHSRSRRAAIDLELQSSRDRLLAVQQEIDCLEKLRQRHWTKAKKRNDRADQLQAEENSLRGWSRN